jgi:uncharacterized protein with ParB-like and HNH nuclease domain
MAVKKAKKFDQLQNQLEKERRTVSFDSYDLSIRQLLDMFTSNDINIAPEYQRRFVWSDTRQSLLIESLFLGIPVPSLFMATNSDATWELVDGVQRLGTLIHFAAGDEQRKTIGKDGALKICELEKLSELNDATYTDLPKSVQLFFQTRPIRVTVLNDKSDLGVRYDLFERLNTGGVALHPQEIRNCIYRGPFNDLLKRLAENENFKEVTKLKESASHNGTREEMVLRFFAYYEKYREFDHSVTDFLNTYMDAANKEMPSRTVVRKFEQTFAFLADELPRGIVRANRNITPINLYEAVAVGAALAMHRDRGPKKNVLSRILNDRELKK